MIKVYQNDNNKGFDQRHCCVTDTARNGQQTDGFRGDYWFSDDVVKKNAKENPGWPINVL